MNISFIQSVFYLPTLIVRLIQLVLPQRIFIATYSPASEQEKQRSISERNRLNRVSYYVRKYHA